MHITRHADAVPYEAPFHTGVDTRRLQGMEVGPTEAEQGRGNERGADDADGERASDHAASR